MELSKLVFLDGMILSLLFFVIGKLVKSTKYRFPIIVNDREIGERWIEFRWNRIFIFLAIATFLVDAIVYTLLRIIY